MLPLLGFDFAHDQWTFPLEIDIVTIEHLERAKLFVKRNIPESKKRNSSKRGDLVQALADAVEDTDSTPRLPRSKVKEDLNIKSAQVEFL